MSCPSDGQKSMTSENPSPIAELPMEPSGSPQGGPKRAREAAETGDGRDSRNAGSSAGNQPLTLALRQQALQVNQQQITTRLQESLEGLGTVSAELSDS